jgi:hypothetical protein
VSERAALLDALHTAKARYSTLHATVRRRFNQNVDPRPQRLRVWYRAPDSLREDITDAGGSLVQRAVNVGDRWSLSGPKHHYTGDSSGRDARPAYESAFLLDPAALAGALEITSCEVEREGLDSRVLVATAYLRPRLLDERHSVESLLLIGCRADAFQLRVETRLPVLRQLLAFERNMPVYEFTVCDVAVNEPLDESVFRSAEADLQ